ALLGIVGRPTPPTVAARAPRRLRPRGLHRSGAARKRRDDRDDMVDTWSARRACDDHAAEAIRNEFGRQAAARCVAKVWPTALCTRQVSHAPKPQNPAAPRGFVLSAPR